MDARMKMLSLHFFEQPILFLSFLINHEMGSANFSQAYSALFFST